MPEFNLTILTTHLMFTKNISVTENKPKWIHNYSALQWADLLGEASKNVRRKKSSGTRSLCLHRLTHMSNFFSNDDHKWS
jgi:hypothetical protein